MLTPEPDTAVLARELFESSQERCRRQSLPQSEVFGFINASRHDDVVKNLARELAESYQERRLKYKPHVAMVGEEWRPQIDVQDRNGPAWTRLVKNLQRGSTSIWGEARIASLWREAKEVTDLMPHPKSREDGRGLVMGYVQSGKTANYTAVIAQAVDVGYDIIIVLTGGSKSLRAQTHARLWGDLENDLDGIASLWSFLPDVPEIGSEKAWEPLCASDIRRGERPDVFKSQPVIIVAKKNSTVLKQVNHLLERAKQRTLREQAVLVIDDEADQASPSSKPDIENARTINTRIREILTTCQPVTYVGYTATPYANVFIDRENEGDLFPHTFIKPIEHGEGYFGAKEFFGSNEMALAAAADFVNIIDNRLVDELSPPASRNGTWTPIWNEAIQEAVLWFLMASAVRRIRDDATRHSSMLVHTGFNVKSHRRLCALLRHQVPRLLTSVSDTDLRSLYERETNAVPASLFGHREISFEEMRTALDEVAALCKVIMDNSESSERLDYSSKEPQVVIAVGGNTLSRGLTLEGLVCSLFVRRSANAYDTLMQMGRWFGYRRGYEDLPRLWTTSELMSMFRKISDIENELRETIKQGVSDGLTPAEMQIEIVRHPGMTITSKMGAAKLQVGLESLGTGQPSYPNAFKTTKTALDDNLAALRNLIASVERKPEKATGRHLIRGVESADIAHFLTRFKFAKDDDLGRFSPDRQLRYLKECEIADGPLDWNVVIVDNPEGNSAWGIEIGLEKALIPVERGQESNPSDGITRFQGILSRTNMLMDLMDSQLVKTPENWIKAAQLRREHIGERTGLLLIYVIYAKSKTRSKRSKGQSLIDLDLPESIVAPVMVFPYKPRATRKLVAVQ